MLNWLFKKKNKNSSGNFGVVNPPNDQNGTNGYIAPPPQAQSTVTQSTPDKPIPMSIPTHDGAVESAPTMVTNVPPPTIQNAQNEEPIIKPTNPVPTEPEVDMHMSDKDRPDGGTYWPG